MIGKNNVLSALYGTGLDQFLLQVYDKVENISGEVGSDIANFEFDGESKGTVLFPLIPGYRTICHRYCILADAFRRRGYEPVLLVNDYILDAPIERTVDQSRAIAAQTKFYQRRIPEKFGLETTPLSELLPEEVEKIAEEPVPGIDVARFARGSTKKYHKVYTLDTEHGETANTYQRFLRAGRILGHAVNSLINDSNVVAVLSHEPYYIQGGVPLNIANNHDIPAYSQVWGDREGTLLFGIATENSLLARYTDNTLLERELATPLSTREYEEIEEAMRLRASGDDIDVDYSAHTNKTVDATDGETLIGVFTNLLWDGSLEPEQAVYGNVYDWLDDTFDAVRNREDIKLVLKTHPAEAKFGTNESVSDWVAEHDAVPENVRLLPPDTNVDTYALLDSLDVAVVYNSTVGLEAAYRGLPVIVAGDTHYRGLGLTVDAESPRIYRKLLTNASDLEPDEERTTKAKRYAHFIFVKKQVPFQFSRQEQGAEQQFNVVRKKDTEPGTEPFDTIVSAMVEGRPVLNPRYADRVKSTQR